VTVASAWLAAASMLATLAAAAAPAPAQPDPAELIDRAQREMIELDFERAIELLEAAEATGRNRRDQLLVIYRSLGESQASLGHRDAAESEFRRLLALAPEAELEPGSSPKIASPFGAARSFMSARPALAATCDQVGRSAVVIVVSDPLDLVAAARPTRADGSALAGGKRATGRPHIRLDIPADAPAAIACAVLDRHGNELLRAPVRKPVDKRPATGDGRGPTSQRGGRDSNEVLPPSDDWTAGDGRRTTGKVGSAVDSPVELGEHGGSAPLYARWWTWGTGALVAATAGTYFALRVQSDADEWRALKRQSTQHTYREAADVEERGRRHALYSNIAFGATAALATVSVVVLVRETKRSPERHAVGLRTTPLPEGGATAALSFSF